MKFAGNERIDRPENHSGNGVRAVIRQSVRKVRHPAARSFSNQGNLVTPQTPLALEKSLNSARILL
jgi:hypothetical protein